MSDRPQTFALDKESDRTLGVLRGDRTQVFVLGGCDRSRFPAVSCIYFAVCDGEIQCIGETQNLEQRWVGA
ncbi:MAG: hypothetical protein AAFX78_18465 [Cyanobacteria bacterium J06638_20]